MPLQRRRRLAWLSCLAGLLAGCVAPQQTSQAGNCQTAQGEPMLAFELFFGRSIQGQAEVSDRAWDDFLDHVVTPNLPNGYTVFDAAGAWLDPATSRTIHEHAKVLLVALPDGPDSAAAITRIRHAYQATFHQTLVGMMVAPTCAAF
jgi:hypothetical protein